MEHSPQEFEAALTRSLERRPEPAVPAGFAARVVRSLPPPSVRPVALHAGRKVAMIAAVVLALALFVLAPHAAPSFASVTFDVELLLLVQLAAIAYWLAARPEM